MITNHPEFDQTSKICYVKNSLEKNCDSCKKYFKSKWLYGWYYTGRVSNLLALFKNSILFLNNLEFVIEAIQGLSRINKILEVDSVPLVINPISVTHQNSGKKRLMLDLRYVKKRICKSKIKFDNLKLMG